MRAADVWDAKRQCALAGRCSLEAHSPNLRHGVIGRGLNDYDKIFNILAGVGYNGWVSIEDGMNGMDEMQASAEFLKKMREKYF